MSNIILVYWLSHCSNWRTGYPLNSIALDFEGSTLKKVSYLWTPSWTNSYEATPRTNLSVWCTFEDSSAIVVSAYQQVFQNTDVCVSSTLSWTMYLAHRCMLHWAAIKVIGEEGPIVKSCTTNNIRMSHIHKISFEVTWDCCQWFYFYYFKTP
jgi:hypothetical protein